MNLTRWVLLIIVLFIGFIGFMMFDSTKSLYKALPANLSTTVPSTPFEEWREFSAANGTFQAKFPALPQQASESILDAKTQEKRKYEMYVSQKNDGSIFMVSLITYPSDSETSNPQELFKTITNEMVASNPQNKLKSIQEGVFLGHPASDFLIENNEINIQGKIFVIDKTLYLLTYLTHHDLYQASEFTHFIDSFSIPAKESVKGN